MSDIIAAVATGLPGAIGIVRLSGAGAAALAGRFLRPVSGKAFEGSENRKMVYCRLLDRDGETIDMVLAVVTRAPHSYTGEECCEIHCHGSPAVLRETMLALTENGARPAGPGEFTKRAFLNGRMDLTAAESVVDLIDAESTQAARNAVGQLEGAVRRRVDGIYEQLLAMTARFQAVVDYPDEDVEDVERDEMREVLGAAAESLAEFSGTFRRGTYLKNGVPTAIIGSPNSGKSTLLNSLVGYERAIVTDIAGTTRDTLEETVSFAGGRLRLIDTAGIRTSDDRVERIGIERSVRAAEEAEIIILVIDGSREISVSDLAAMDAAASGAKKVIPVLNKSDLGILPETQSRVEERFGESVVMSAARGAGIEELESAVRAALPENGSPCGGEIITNVRQQEAVRRAETSVRGAMEALEMGLTPDAVMSDVEISMGALGEITGRSVSQDIVSEIFARFCVGK